MTATGGGATHKEEAQVQEEKEIILRIILEKRVTENKTNTVVAAATEIMLF